MSTTTKSSSTQGVNLGPQSSLEEYLGGQEQTIYSPAQKSRITEIQEELKTIGDKQVVAPSGRLVKSKKKLEEELYQIEQDAQKKRTGGLLEEGVKKLADLGAAGAPTELFNEGQAAGKDLATLLKSYQESGGLPGEQDITQANSLASNLFSARRTQLQQSLQDQYTDYQREAGRRGFASNDPVLNAKLRTGFMRQQDMLNAEQQAQGTQIAMGLPGQRLGFAAQRADTLSTLADRENARYQQGIANLSALLGVGQSMLQGEQNWRYTTSDKWSESKQTESGLGPALSAVSAPIAAAGGIMSGIGAMQQGTSFSKLFAPAAQAAPQVAPQASPNYNLGNYNLRF